MVQVNQTVLDKKGQKGVITRIITKSTGYVEVAYENGISKKEMAFNLTDETGKPLRKAPKRKEPAPPTQMQVLTSLIMAVNGYVRGYRGGQSYQLWLKNITAIWLVAQEKGDNFIVDICDSCERDMRVSEKQAFYLARFAIKNDITF